MTRNDGRCINLDGKPTSPQKAKAERRRMLRGKKTSPAQSRATKTLHHIIFRSFNRQKANNQKPLKGKETKASSPKARKQRKRELKMRARPSTVRHIRLRGRSAGTWLRGHALRCSSGAQLFGSDWGKWNFFVCVTCSLAAVNDK